MKAYIFFLYAGSNQKLQVSHGPVSCIFNNCFEYFMFVLVLSRAVALGLTAEDMMNVYEYQENLKEQKKVKEMETSTAEVIKREVVHQQMDAQVCRRGVQT